MKKLTILFAISIMIISCKKENLNLNLGSKSEIIKADALSNEHILTSNRTLENSVLAVEYQLNVDLVDSNTYNGSIEGGNDKIDIFNINYSVNNNENLEDYEQIDIYGMISDSIEEKINKRYEDPEMLELMEIRVIDVEVNEELSRDNELVFNVVLVTFIRGLNCGCTFTTLLPWASEDPDAGCTYANIKIQWMLNNNCDGYEPAGKKRYDFKNIVVGTFESASSDLGNVELDASISTTELTTLKSSITLKYNNLKNSTNGNRIRDFRITANFPWFEESEPNSYTLEGTYYKSTNGALPF